MTSAEIRQQFLDFFKNKEHKIIPSSSVVPFDDPTLLFTNAGMNQFKDVFLGTGTRKYKRAADTQKCIRVSGKHNDLEEVGHDTYHHTFFEMLGNWSFGDPEAKDHIGAGYYKKEAITWAWELLIKTWKLPKERLWATVYNADDEAYNFWKNNTDINPNHILRFDEKDNFWEMGETGPCGPCSEIHINLSDDFENPKYVNAGLPECIEIWNLVFIQYNRDKEGKLHDLPAKHVDTGMGFERVCAVLQNKTSNYDTDIFSPIIEAISAMSGVKYDTEEHKIPMRVIADHLRMLSFAIADGAVPSNEGRGYVLRRILRRASRYGRKINLDKPFIYQLVKVLVEYMSDVFPELKHKQDHIEKIIKAEEESFNITLDRGIELFEKIASKPETIKQKKISGEDVFLLYDTYGFPVDLTNVMARERNLSIDETRFNELMNEQKTRSKSKNKFEVFQTVYDNAIPDYAKFETKFIDYDYTKFSHLVKKTLQIGTLVLFDETPFYPESGGQVGDTGYIIWENRKIKILNTKWLNGKIVHEIEEIYDEQYPGTLIHITDFVRVEVDEKRRWDIMRNHTATHLLHAALRKILGSHVHQSGSYVGPDRLRFDFAHYSKLTEEEINKIESLVNEQIWKNIELTHHRSIPFEEAKKMGALMFFGDKYGDKVNVIQVGNFSMEFCGGTHVKNTSQIGIFKIVSESSIASGIRRIEAVTGRGVDLFIKQQAEEINKDEEKINQLIEEKKKLEKQKAELDFESKLDIISEILSEPTDYRGIKIYKGKLEASSMDELKSFGDELRAKMREGIGVLISEIEGKVGIVCVVTDKLIKEKKLSAGKIVGDIAKFVGGGGGGRPHLATAGGKDLDKMDEAFRNVEKVVEKYL